MSSHVHREGVGELHAELQPPLPCQPPKERQSLVILKDPKAGGLQNDPIHHLGKSVFIIPALDDDGLFDPRLHISPRGRMAQ